MIARWFLAVWLLVTPSLAQGQATLELICAEERCALVTAGTQETPSGPVRRRVAELRDAGGWSSITPESSATGRWREQPSSVPHLAHESWQLEEVHTTLRALLGENQLTAIVVVHAEPDLAVEVVRSVDIVRIPTAREAANGDAADGDRLRASALALGVTALAGAATSWSLVVWSSLGPTPDLIASANTPQLTQARYDSLEARWRHTRLALHATGAASAVIADLALALHGDRLRRWPVWMHWTLGALGLALATYGAIEIGRTPECEGSDPRFCANNTYRLDRGAMMLYTAIPLLSEPLIGRVWRPRVSVEPTRSQASILLTWPL